MKANKIKPWPNSHKISMAEVKARAPQYFGKLVVSNCDTYHIDHLPWRVTSFYGDGRQEVLCICRTKREALERKASFGDEVQIENIRRLILMERGEA